MSVLVTVTERLEGAGGTPDRGWIAVGIAP